MPEQILGQWCCADHEVDLFCCRLQLSFPFSSPPPGENAAERLRKALVVKLGEPSSPETACRHGIPITEIYGFLWKGRHRTRETLACVSHQNPHTSSAHCVQKFRHWSCTVRCPLKRDLPTLFPSTWTWDVNYAVLTTNSVFERFSLQCRSFTYCLDLRHACSVWNLGTYTKANQWELRNAKWLVQNFIGCFSMKIVQKISKLKTGCFLGHENRRILRKVTGVRRWTKVNIWRCWKQSNKTPKQIAKKWWQNKPQNMSAPKETWIGKTSVAWQIFNLQGCLELLGLGEKQVGQQLRCGKELVKVKTASFDRSWFLIAYPFHKGNTDNFWVLTYEGNVWH